MCLLFVLTPAQHTHYLLSSCSQTSLPHRSWNFFTTTTTHLLPCYHLPTLYSSDLFYATTTMLPPFTCPPPHTHCTLRSFPPFLTFYHLSIFSITPFPVCSVIPSAVYSPTAHTYFPHCHSTTHSVWTYTPQFDFAHHYMPRCIYIIHTPCSLDCCFTPGAVPAMHACTLFSYYTGSHHTCTPI